MKSYDNAFELIADAPEAALLVEKSRLMNNIIDRRVQLGLTQLELSKVLKVSQPRTSALLRGKISTFSLSACFFL